MQSNFDPLSLIVPAVHAAFMAGRRVLEIYGQDFSVETKPDDSPLTLADKEAHDIIVSRLRPFGVPILSEEGRNIPYAQRSGWDRFWMVDPLDGTKEFIKKNGEFTINIALVRHQYPIMGVVYVPVRRRLYYAAAGLGSFRYDIADETAVPHGSLEALTASSRRLNAHETGDRSYTIVGSRSHATPELESFVAQKRQEYRTVEFLSAGSSLKFCLVAEGRADVYPRMGPTMEWDTAAGHVVAEQAGAPVFRLDNGKPLLYNKPDLRNPWFLVARAKQP